MAASPRWKVYTADGEYEGSVKTVESAAHLVSFLGEGATIRDGHRVQDVVWQEGVGGIFANTEIHFAYDSYDLVAEIVNSRTVEALAQRLANRGRGVSAS